MQVQLNPDFSVKVEGPNATEKWCWNYTKDEFNPDSLMPLGFSCACLCWFCHAGSECTEYKPSTKAFYGEQLEIFASSKYIAGMGLFSQHRDFFGLLY